MRLVSFLTSGERRVGVLLDRGVLDLNRADPMLPNDVVALLQGGAPTLERARRAVTTATSEFILPLAAVQLLAPIPRPPKIICIGRNYDEHVTEVEAVGLRRMAKPSVFIKVSSSVIASGEAIVRPTTTQQLDYEGELAVVIGRIAKAVDRDHALEYVAGYTILNDVSARDLQLSKDGGVIVGKNFDTSAPMGPYVALTDELPDPRNLRLRTWVNADLRQDGNTSGLIFDIPTIIAYLTQQLTLEPGDVISTGTPAGTGVGMRPQVWLQPGDTVRVEIDRLGVLENPVVGSG